MLYVKEDFVGAEVFFENEVFVSPHGRFYS